MQGVYARCMQGAYAYARCLQGDGKGCMQGVCKLHLSPLVEARQPAQAFEVLQVDVRGVGVLSHGRRPPERLTPTTTTTSTTTSVTTAATSTTAAAATTTTATRGVVGHLERTNGHAARGDDGEAEPG